MGITLQKTNIAMEDGPCVDNLPIKNGDFPCCVKLSEGN